MEKEVINVPLALAKLYGFEDGLQLEASKELEDKMKGKSDKTE